MTQGIEEPMFPSDLTQWRAWQDRRRRASRGLGALRSIARHRSQPQPFVLTGPPNADVVIAFDSVNPPTVRTLAALIADLRSKGASVAVLDAGDAQLRPGVNGPSHTVNPASLRGGTYLSIGHFAPVGYAVWQTSRRHGGRFLVMQHGLLTPFTPPLASGTHLLAWSSADGEYWSAARGDVSFSPVGSHLLSAARTHSPAAFSIIAAPARPLFLGQMHGAELAWSTKLSSALEFCTSFDAEYRPHPAEYSLLSRATHVALRTARVTISHEGGPLATTDRPIVSMFSTGLLEASAAGLDTFGYAHNPPAWLHAFWERYRIGSWPHTPTQIDPLIVQADPDLVIDAIVREVMV